MARRIGLAGGQAEVVGVAEHLDVARRDRGAGRPDVHERPEAVVVGEVGRGVDRHPGPDHRGDGEAGERTGGVEVAHVRFDDEVRLAVDRVVLQPPQRVVGAPGGSCERVLVGRVDRARPQAGRLGSRPVAGAVLAGAGGLPALVRHLQPDGFEHRVAAALRRHVPGDLVELGELARGLQGAPPPRRRGPWSPRAGTPPGPGPRRSPRRRASAPGRASSRRPRDPSPCSAAICSTSGPFCSESRRLRSSAACRSFSASSALAAAVTPSSWVCFSSVIRCSSAGSMSHAPHSSRKASIWVMISARSSPRCRRGWPGTPGWPAAPRSRHRARVWVWSGNRPRERTATATVDVTASRNVANVRNSPDEALFAP